MCKTVCVFQRTHLPHDIAHRREPRAPHVATLLVTSVPQRLFSHAFVPQDLRGHAVCNAKKRQRGGKYLTMRAPQGRNEDDFSNSDVLKYGRRQTPLLKRTHTCNCLQDLDAIGDHLQQTCEQIRCIPFRNANTNKRIRTDRRK